MARNPGFLTKNVNRPEKSAAVKGFVSRFEKVTLPVGRPDEEKTDKEDENTEREGTSGDIRKMTSEISTKTVKQKQGKKRGHDSSTIKSKKHSKHKKVARMARGETVKQKSGIEKQGKHRVQKARKPSNERGESSTAKGEAQKKVKKDN